MEANAMPGSCPGDQVLKYIAKGQRLALVVKQGSRDSLTLKLDDE